MRDGFDLIFVRICKVKLSGVCVRICKVKLSWVFEGTDLIYNFKILENYQIKNLVGLDFSFPAISHKILVVKRSATISHEILVVIHSTTKYGYLVARRKTQWTEKKLAVRHSATKNGYLVVHKKFQWIEKS